ncbi:MAG: aminoacyl-tRNA hydrolase, partial [Deltaproteobacteria bacterium]|nr:aminoacyl-tRNA hydrolase [Deltaproteobacteria bacterium]
MTTLIVGLGNPGEKYRFTRHNSGFLALEELSARWNIPLNQKGFRSVYGKGLWEGRQVVLSQPQTYMNASGGAVRDIAAFFKIIPQNIIVIHDDLDFPLG